LADATHARHPENRQSNASHHELDTSPFDQELDTSPFDWELDTLPFRVVGMKHVGLSRVKVLTG